MLTMARNGRMRHGRMRMKTRGLRTLQRGSALQLMRRRMRIGALHRLVLRLHLLLLLLRIVQHGMRDRVRHICTALQCRRIAAVEGVSRGWTCRGDRLLMMMLLLRHWNVWLRGVKCRRVRVLSLHRKSRNVCVNCSRLPMMANGVLQLLRVLQRGV